MIVKDLIEVLKACPQDAQVVATWDGGWSTMEIYLLRKDDDNRDVVEFDVSDYGSYRLDRHE